MNTSLEFVPLLGVVVPELHTRTTVVDTPNIKRSEIRVVVNETFEVNFTISIEHTEPMFHSLLLTTSISENKAIGFAFINYVIRYYPSAQNITS
jgi:hypothetical protein|tara:strand:- start:4739 stop:5020 length:282 start_codon:yes stop_codon:yes gene_type:complete